MEIIEYEDIEKNVKQRMHDLRNALLHYEHE